MKLGVFVSDYVLTNDILERIKAEKLGLILVANGVYHATIKEKGKPSPVLEKTASLYALQEDVQTRGIAESSVDSRVKLVNYGGVVDLIFNEFDKVIWL
jgi:sulfur relay protein TusB/DsrH